MWLQLLTVQCSAAQTHTPYSKRSPFHIIPCHRVPGLYSEQYHCPALWWGRGGLGPGVKTEFYRMCSTALWPLCCNYLYIKPGGMFGQIDQLPDQLNYILTIKTSIKHLLQFYCHCYLLLIDRSSSQCTHCIYSIFTILSPRPITPCSQPAGERNISRPNVVQDLV